KDQPMNQRTWAARGERWDDAPALVAQRRACRDLYAVAQCAACGESFANFFVLWRHRPQDVPPGQQRCLSASQLYRSGMYRVASLHKGDGIWHDVGRISPLGQGVSVRETSGPTVVEVNVVPAVDLS